MADIDEIDGVSDEEVEALTACEVLQKLEEAWLNEKFSPELLEAKTDLVDCMLEQVTEMEENIKRAKKGGFQSCFASDGDRQNQICSEQLSQMQAQKD